MADSSLPLLVGVGAGAAALYFWQRKKRAEASPIPHAAQATPTRPADPWVDPKPSAPTQPKPSAPPTATPPSAPTKPPTSPAVAQLTGRWVWPVPQWNGRKPVISSGWGSPRPGGPHAGADIMFKRMPSDPFPPGTPNGSKGFVMPNNLPALAASDGVVWSAGWGPGGFSVVIDHGPRKVATYYNHLSQLLVTPTSRAKSGQRVYAGQPLGIIGASPRDGARLMHLHFALWLGGPKDAVDVAPLVKSWEYVNDPRPPSSTPAPSKPPPPSKPGPAMVARNASLQYRPVGGRSEPYPDWVRALDGESGVYVIREIDRDGTPEVVYVGSSKGRLYDTLTRHFQMWRRYKGFWKGQFAEGHDPGLTYDRARVDVAVRLTSHSDALDEEARLIARLRPRDNLLLQPEEETVPF